MVQANKIESESDSENELSYISSKPKRFGVLVSSEDEDDPKEVNECKSTNSDPVSLNHKESVKNNKSDDDAPHQAEKEIRNISKNNNKFKFKLLSASDIESENESEGKNDVQNENLHKSDKNSSDAASNDEDEEERLATSYERDKNVKKNCKKTKKTKPSKAIDAKLQIRSETQRMEREMSVNLPYHRPKQRSLREFLSRKKSHQSIKADALRLTTGNMIHTWEAIDKSIKETADFFKVDSEDDNSNEATDVLNSVKESTTVMPSEITEIIPNQLTNPVNDNLAIDLPMDNTEKPDHTLDNTCKISPSNTPTTEPPIAVNEVDLGQSDNLIVAENIAEIEKIESQNKTESWLKDIAAYEKRENLRNKLQLSPSVLDKVPTLTNDAFVDLDNSDSETSELQPGAKKLMDRLLKFQEPKTKLQTSLKTTVAELDETGQVQNVSIEVVPFTQSKTNINSDGLKPGAKLQKFREKLKNEIEAKWEEEYKKRCPEVPVKSDFEENAESDEDDEAYEGECDESSEEESEPEEEDIMVQDKPRRFCEFGNSEAEESEGDGDVEDDDNEEPGQCDSEIEEKESDKELEKTESEDLDCSLLPAFQPGGGLLMGGSTLTQQTQPLPLHDYSPASSPAVFKNHTPVVGSQRDEKVTPQTPRNCGVELEVKSVKKNLFGGDDNANEDADDPFAFVSGAFPETGAAPPQPTQDPSLSQSKLKRIIMMDDSDQENEDVKSNNELIDQSDIRSVAATENEMEFQKSDTKLHTKKAAKLVFSDESEDDGDYVNENKSEVEESEEETDAEVEEKVDADLEYDSEENEVVKVRPGEFFEQEAELSESEWSGDEDEKGLDVLEAEAGDADVLDEEQVASQLGRIHMRRVLDDDARDVRLLQEILLEDGDLHADGKARDRKFRWKNLNAGFDLNGEHKDEDGSDGENEVADPELAKLRHEKNQFLIKLQQEGKLDSFVEEYSGKENSVVALGKLLLQRLRSVPQAPSTTSASKTVYARGSFLSKDENFLNRLSRVATTGNDGPLGPSSSKNFVFAVQEKEVVEVEETVTKDNLKRKATISCKETVKRAKLIFKSQPSLLDQLHEPEAII